MNKKMHDTRSKNQTSLVDSRGLSLKNLSLEEGFVSDSHRFFNHWASLSVHKYNTSERYDMNFGAWGAMVCVSMIITSYFNKSHNS